MALADKMKVIPPSSGDSSPGSTGSESSLREQLEALETMESQNKPAQKTLHPAFYVMVWITLSSSVILFNKWILDTAQFKFPIFLTTWHLVFATIATRVLARTSTLLDGLKTVQMNGRIYVRAIMPIGLFFSLSLICGNIAYLYLSVAFIQMLKATTPVAVLLASWSMAIEKPNFRVLGNVSIIVIGVILATYGEVKFHLVGFVFQIVGVGFEATRLVMVQRLLSSSEYKMDPLVSLYYFAPVCAAFNFVIFLFFEASTLTLDHILDVGLLTLFVNAGVAFGLNISVVFLIGKTSSLVLTLCGVLKDILLVVASVLIWGTAVTALQVFGYSIALTGLVYFKLGGEKIKESYTRLRADGALAWDEYGKKYPAWRRALVAGASIFVVLLTFGFLYPRYSANAAEITRLEIPQLTTKVIDPKIANQRIDTPLSTIDQSYSPDRQLDIVVSVVDKSLAKLTKRISELKDMEKFKRLQPRIILYVKNEYLDDHAVREETKADIVIKLDNRARESGAYLSHIIGNWNDIAAHTIFLKDEMTSFDNMKRRIKDYFTEETGMLSLGTAHSVCTCDNCHDPWSIGDTWTRLPEIFSSVYGELCPPANVLISQGGQFIVSARRIRGTPKRTYEHFKAILESDKDHWIHKDPKAGHKDVLADPYFGRVLERSWMIIFKCADPRLAVSCPKLETPRNGEDSDDNCQCLDIQMREKKSSRIKRN